MIAVPFHLSWREIVLKYEKVYKCFFQDYSYGDEILKVLSPNIWNQPALNIKSETSWIRFREYINTWFGPQRNLAFFRGINLLNFNHHYLYFICLYIIDSFTQYQVFFCIYFSDLSSFMFFFLFTFVNFDFRLPRINKDFIRLFIHSSFTQDTKKVNG